MLKGSCRITQTKRALNGSVSVRELRTLSANENITFLGNTTTEGSYGFGQWSEEK